MQPPVPGMGVGNVSGVPTDVMAALFPYWSQMMSGPMDLALAQYQGNNARDIASTQANASMYNAQTDAQARMAAAQASIAAQQVQSQAALKGIQAQIAADIQRAQGGDRNAAFRLQSELQLQAQIANQNNRLQVAQLASSTGLRDAVAARMFVKGLGPQAQFGSAMLAGPMQEITPGQVQFQGYGNAPTVDTNVGGGNWTAPSFAPPPMISGGGGSSSGLDLNSLFGQSNDMFKNLFGTLGLNTTPTATTPTVTAPTTQPYKYPVGGYTSSPLKAGGPTNAGDQPFISGGKVLGVLHPDGTVTMNPSTPQMAKGGRSDQYEAIIVGEKGPEVRMKTPYGEFVAPIKGSYADGGVVPAYGTKSILKPKVYQMGDSAKVGQNTPAPVVEPPPLVSGVDPALEEEPAPAPTGTTVTTPDGTTVTSGQPNINPGGAGYTTPTPGMNDIQALPSSQILLGQEGGWQGYNANQTWDLPENGMFNLQSAEMVANKFVPGAMDPWTLQDLLQQFAQGGMPSNVLEHRINRATPGTRSTQQRALAY